MMRCFTTIFCVLIFATACCSQESIIEIENKPLHKINKFIYGNFVEFLGDADGGFRAAWDEKKDSFREDVIKAFKELNIPTLRFPGGCFADTYHWKNGIGPRDKRPVVKNGHWGGYEDNKIGTDEFIQLCKIIGAEPSITVNFGTGTPQEAAEWVHYCNIKNSYNVKYWEIGNEIYGFWEKGTTEAYDYAKRYLEFAKEMKKVDKSIKLIAVGDGTSVLGHMWNRKVLRTAGSEMDYLSLHFYAPGYSSTGEDEKVYYSVLTQPDAISSFLLETKKWIDKANRNIKITVNEWNVGVSADFWEERLKAAIFSASLLNAFQRLGGFVDIANFAQLINTKWGITTVKANEENIYVTPNYLVLKLYADHTGEFSLPVQLKDAPYLDAAASLDAGKLYVHAVNKDINKDVTALIKLNGFKLKKTANVFYIHADSIDARNTFEDPEFVKIRSRQINNAGSAFPYTFPAHSITVLELFLN